MKREELKLIFGVTDSDIDYMLQHEEDTAFLKKKYHEAVKINHPDMGGKADKFRLLKEVYNTICNSGIKNVVDDAYSGTVVLPIDEARLDNKIVTDITGISHDRKVVFSMSNVMVMIKLNVTLDGKKCDVVWKMPHNIRSTYYMEVRPLMTKEEYNKYDEHDLKIVIENTYDKISNQVKFKSPTRAITMRLRGPKFVLDVKTSIQFADISKE